MLNLLSLGPVVHFNIFLLFQIKVSPTLQTQDNKVSAAALCLWNLRNFTAGAAPAASVATLAADCINAAASTCAQKKKEKKSHCHFSFSSAGHQNVLRETDLICLRSSRLRALTRATAPAPPRPHPIWFSKFNHMSVQCLDWGKHELWHSCDMSPGETRLWTEKNAAPMQARRERERREFERQKRR